MIPIKPEEITKDWLTNVLRKSQNEGVEVLSLTKFDSTKGYLSYAMNAKIRYEDKVHSLFIKINPLSQEHLEILKTNNLDVTEIEAYKTYFKYLKSMSRQHNGKYDEKIAKFIPQFYCGEYELNNDKQRRGYYLILDDLTASNYDIVDFNNGLSKDQILKTMEALANIHAYGFSWALFNPKLAQDDYPYYAKFFDDCSESDNSLHSFMQRQFQMCLDDLIMDEEYKHLHPKLENLFRPYMNKGNIGELASKILAMDSETATFIIHGDLWGNNLMFHKTTNNCKVVDWQFLCAAKSPYLDLATTAFISMKPRDTEKYIDDFLSKYYETFVESCRDLGTHDRIPWKSSEDFKSRSMKASILKAFMWTSTSYEIVEKYPAIKKNFFWIIEKSMELHPSFFD